MVPICAQIVPWLSAASIPCPMATDVTAAASGSIGGRRRYSRR
jgi:hypothetical protein